MVLEKVTDEDKGIFMQIVCHMLQAVCLVLIYSIALFILHRHVQVHVYIHV